MVYILISLKSREKAWVEPENPRFSDAGFGSGLGFEYGEKMGSGWVWVRFF